MSGIVDVNVWLSHWPARRLPYDDTPELVNRLRTLKVAQAWVGSFDMLLHRDIAGVNQRLADACQTAPELLIPCGAINPLLPDWEDDIRRCAEVHGMRILRLTPAYHGYDLGNERLLKLLTLATDRNLLVQIVVRMEDERTQPPLLQAKDVDVAPLEKLLVDFPTSKIQILNSLHSASAQQWLQRGVPKNLTFDLGTLEGAAGITRILKTLPPSQLCFGTHFPFFTWEATELKLRESALPEPIRRQIMSSNATELLN